MNWFDQTDCPRLGNQDNSNSAWCNICNKTCKGD
jgi:hypothetical protein